MDNKTRVPRKGDRIQIAGFLGVFEVIELREDGLCADLKHLSLPCWDHTEENLPSKELVYLNPLPPEAGSSRLPNERSERKGAPVLRKWVAALGSPEPQTSTLSLR
ncbi:MAG: hypothetical protein ABR956_19270 [Terracidiphilus sp.]|jgi:hypothetical protein